MDQSKYLTKNYPSSDRGSPVRNLSAGAGDPPDGHQDEDPGGAAPGLPEAHRRAEGESVRQGGALHHAPNRRKFSPLAGKQKGTLQSPHHHHDSSVCHHDPLNTGQSNPNPAWK